MSPRTVGLGILWLVLIGAYCWLTMYQGVWGL